MKSNPLKSLVRRWFFRPGQVRRIRFGALASYDYRVSETTGMSAWYSGPEGDHHRAFAKVLRPGDTAIDIGANWGAHSLLFSRLVGPTGTVIAVEPFPPALEELKWHLAKNNRANVRIIDSAVSDKPGYSSFAAGHSAYTGHLVSDGAVAEEDSKVSVLSVETTTLDDLVRNQKLQSVRLIKVDVEGAESLVLQGADEVIKTFRPHWVVDLHTPEQDVRVANLLVSRDYTLQRLSGPPIKRTDVGWPEKDGVWGSILATPKS